MTTALNIPASYLNSAFGVREVKALHQFVAAAIASVGTNPQVAINTANIAANTAAITALAARVTALEGQYTALDARVVALETAP